MITALQMNLDAMHVWLTEKMNSPNFLWEVMALLIWVGVAESILKEAFSKDGKKGGINIIMSFLTDTDFGVFNCLAVSVILCIFYYVFGLVEMGILFVLMVMQYRFVGHSADPVVKN